MPVSSRRGFTLPDLLTGLLLLGLIATIGVRTTLVYGRLLSGQRERSGLQGAFTTSFTLLAEDLSDVAPGDLRQISPDLLEYRAFRSSGLACDVSATEVRVLLERFSGTRLPQAGRDSLLIYVGRVSPQDSTGEWLPAPVLAVGRSACGGRPAYRLTTAIDSASLRTGTLSLLVPVRTFEVVQARVYASLGAWWLGIRSVSAGEMVQPVAGPLEQAGTQFRYLDSSGTVTLVPQDVRRVRFALAGRAAGWNGATGAIRDSAELVFPLPNLRP